MGTFHLRSWQQVASNLKTTATALQHKAGFQRKAKANSPSEIKRQSGVPVYNLSDLLSSKYRISADFNTTATALQNKAGFQRKAKVFEKSCI